MKDGKFNVWDSTDDEYLLEEWVDEKTVKEFFIRGLTEIEEKRIRREIREAWRQQIASVKEGGFCGIRFFKCTPELIEEIIALRKEDEKDD